MPREELEIGFLSIALPSASCRGCSIMHDLAGSLGLAFNSEALERFQEAWRVLGYRRRLGSDHEADYVFLDGGRDAILDAAVLIHELAGKPLSEEEIHSARLRLKSHKRPKPKPWKIGAVFALPLGDGTHAFGQVLWNPPDFNAPTCSLFEHRAADTASDLDEILTSRTLCILHVQSESLDEGDWPIVGTADPINDPFTGPCGHPSKVGAIHFNGIEAMARAWWGFAPWNAYYKPDYLDFYLLPGVERSKHAWLLTPAELESFRSKMRGSE